MKIKLPTLTGVFATLAILLLSQLSFSQTPSGPNETARLKGLELELNRFLETEEEATIPAPGRPRIVDKVSNVKASVAVNNLAVSRAIFDLMNQKRIENGEKALAWNENLAKVANLHSQNMADFSFFSHRGLDNKMVSDRADDVGVGRWRAIGENIAYERGHADPVTKAIQLWLDSPAHRKNMLNGDWREAAIGVAVATDGSYYFTQVFLRK